MRKLDAPKKNMADLADVLVVEMVPLEILAMMPAEEPPNLPTAPPTNRVALNG